MSEILISFLKRAISQVIKQKITAASIVPEQYKPETEQYALYGEIFSTYSLALPEL